MINGTERRPMSPPLKTPISPPPTHSPQLFALQARQKGEWKDLIYREALKMSGSLRQIISGNNPRSQLAKKFLKMFHELLFRLRKPNGLIKIDSDYLNESDNFENLLLPWIEIFQSENLIGPFISSSLISIRSFFHSGMFTSPQSPFSRPFVQDLVFTVAHSRFEPTNLENDEIIMLELIEFLSELVQITIVSTKSSNYSNLSIQNDEIIGETFLFQLFDLLFVLLNQNRFSELLRSKAIEIVVDQCSLLFSSMKKITKISNNTVPSVINFPNIVKPQKPSNKLTKSNNITNININNSISNTSGNNSNSPSNLSPYSPDALINVKNFDSVIIVDNNGNVGGTELTDNSGNTNNFDSLESFNNDGEERENIDHNNTADYNPFKDEDENELAPDAIEEVMKFRAKLAGVSMETTHVDEVSDVTVDLTYDRLSSHALREVLSFLIRCIDIIDTPAKKVPGSVGPVPNNSANNALSTKVIPSIKTQTTAMKCLTAIFTDPISDLSKSIHNPTEFESEIIEIIGNDLLKNLMIILALDPSSRHLSSLCQLFLVIFTNYRKFLPAQFEYFLTTCLNVISAKPSSGAISSISSAGGANPGNSKSVPPRPALIALKTVCLEMIAYFLQDPSFIAQLFVYYECSLDYQNTLELLTRGISAGMEKTNGNEEIINLSGEILCNFIKTIEASLIKIHSKAEIANLKDLLEQRRIKMIYSEAAVLFNSNPKEAFRFLQQKELLSSEPTKQEIASFLRKAQGLDKKGLGEYLAKPDNIEILREFFSAFKFSESIPLDLALRQVLESFRLPGEAQQIDRIMECFAQIYYPSAKSNFKSQDSCFILSYSTLMLNTDLHNPQVKHKMTLNQFIKNNRGIDDGGDLDEEYLANIYNSIKNREIVMPEEHGGQEAFTSQWNEVQGRKEISNITGYIDIDKLTLSPLVCGIVEIVWKPIILSLIPYINQQRPTGEVIGDGPLEALRGIASLFEKFQMTEALDALLGNIWSVSNLIPVFSAASGNMIPRYLARLPGFRQVVQLIVDIFCGQGDGLKSSWNNWCRLLIMLSESGLLHFSSVITQEVVLFDSKNAPVSFMSLIKMAHEGRQIQPVGKQSFMSSITRFFGSDKPQESLPASSSASNSIDDVTVIAKQFIDNLPIVQVIIKTIPNLQQSNFVAAIESICTHLKWNLGAGASSGKRIPQSSTIGLNWTEDTLILLTETLVTIGLACAPVKEAELVLPLVFDTLTQLVLQDPCPPVKLCEHAVVGLGRLMHRLSEEGILPIERFVGYLKFWCQLSPQLQGFTLEPSLALISLILEKHMNTRKGDSADIWPPLFTILSTASKFETSSPYTLKLLNLICMNPEFPVDFFTEYVDLLSSSIVSCTPANTELKVFDPWRNGEIISRGQLAEESVSIYEKLFKKLGNGFGVWKDYLIPLESNLSRHGPLHSLKSIRQSSINLLTRLLPQLPPPCDDDSSPVAPVIFSKVLIPLMMDLRLRQTDCDEIVMRSCSLVCKTFLFHLSNLGQPTAQLWKEILESMLPLILAGNPSEMMKESVLESCKNVLLVMQSSGEIDVNDEVWRVSDVMLAPFIPGWKIEIEMRLKGHGFEEVVTNVTNVTINEDIITNENINPIEKITTNENINLIESSFPDVITETNEDNCSSSHVDLSTFEPSDTLLSLDDIITDNNCNNNSNNSNSNSSNSNSSNDTSTINV